MVYLFMYNDYLGSQFFIFTFIGFKMYVKIPHVSKRLRVGT